MTPIEQLEIIEKKLGCLIGLENEGGWRLYRDVSPDDSSITDMQSIMDGGLPMSDNLEEAIALAYEKVCPPFPDKFGEGNDAWEWTQEHCSSEYSWCCKRGKHHSVDWIKAVYVTQDTYMFRRANTAEHAAICVTKQAHENFLELIGMNPNLKPPEELEWGVVEK